MPHGRVAYLARKSAVSEVPAVKPHTVSEVKDNLVAKYVGCGCHVSVDHPLSSGAFVDIVADRGTSVRIFSVRDMLDLYQRKDGRQKHDEIRSRILATRGSILNAAREYSDFANREGCEVYLNCLYLDILRNRPDTQPRAVNLHAMIFLHPEMKDSSVYFIQ